MREREVYGNCLYRHYKGDLYYVIGLAWNASNDHDLDETVVYHALYGENFMYVRDKEEFLSEVEEGKENPTGQRYRFELAQEVD